MTAVAKNLSETTVTAVAGLAPLAGALRRPRDYYQGRRRGGRELPDNILLFFRREAKTLLGGAGPVRHFHHRYVLVVPLRGRGRIVVDGRVFSLEPGRCALIAPYQFHHFTRFDAERIGWLFITFEEAAPGVSGTILRPSADGFWADLRRLLEDYLRGDGGGEKGDALACRLALLLGDLSRARAVRAESRKRASGGEDLLFRVHGMVAGSMRRMLPIAEMARGLGLSASHLRTKFRAGSGRSLGVFQREVRLQKAAELFVQGKATVAEVAEACGWESPFAFSRAFRRYWGRSPKRFALFAQGR